MQFNKLQICLISRDFFFAVIDGFDQWIISALKKKTKNYQYISEETNAVPAKNKSKQARNFNQIHNLYEPNKKQNNNDGALVCLYVHNNIIERVSCLDTDIRTNIWNDDMSNYLYYSKNWSNENITNVPLHKSNSNARNTCEWN